MFKPGWNKGMKRSPVYWFTERKYLDEEEGWLWELIKCELIGYIFEGEEE